MRGHLEIILSNPLLRTRMEIILSLSLLRAHLEVIQIHFYEFQLLKYYLLCPLMIILFKATLELYLKIVILIIE